MLNIKIKADYLLKLCYLSIATIGIAYFILLQNVAYTTSVVAARLLGAPATHVGVFCSRTFLLCIGRQATFNYRIFCANTSEVISLLLLIKCTTESVFIVTVLILLFYYVLGYSSDDMLVNVNFKSKLIFVAFLNSKQLISIIIISLFGCVAYGDG